MQGLRRRGILATNEDADLDEPLKDIPADPYNGKPPPTGRFYFQRTGKHGVGHTLAEYNFGLVESFKHNLTRIHLPLLCAHGPEYDCDLFFGPGSGAVYTEQEFYLATRLGHLKRIRIFGNHYARKGGAICGSAS